MLRGLFSFYWECIRRAFRGKFRLVEGWSGGLAILLLFISYMLNLSPEAERVVQVDIPLLFFIGTFMLTVFVGLITAPYDIFREEQAARLALEERRRPRLQVILPGSGLASISLESSTLETYGGNRCTNITKWTDTAIYLLVTNLGETAARKCRARVLWASRENPAGVVESAGIIEAIELPWSKKAPDEHLSTDIAPGDTARIFVAHVRQQGNLWVFRDEVPAHYKRVFGDEGHHRILIQIDSENVATTQILLSATTAAAVKPVGNGAWTPTASVSLLGQGGPVLEHPDIPRRIGADVQSLPSNGTMGK